MTAWTSQVAGRFKALLNVKEISDAVSDDGLDGDSDEVKDRRVAVARNRNASDVQAAHEALTALAFSGYRDWCEYDDDDWLRNCLGQILDDDQSRLVLSALENAGLLDLTMAVRMMAGDYRAAWQRAAEAEFAGPDAEAGASELNSAENTESWKYSRTPGTRYYIYHDGQYLYCDDKDAPLAAWATAEARDEQAASRATEWETGSGVYYTSYENPAHVMGVTHVFGQSRYGPWVLNRAQAEERLAASRRQPEPTGAVAAGSPVEPYYDTGHFTKYENARYVFGETADARAWYASYAELLAALAARERAEPGDRAERADESGVAEGTGDPLKEIFDLVPAAIALDPGDLWEAIQEGLSRAEPA